MGMIINLLASWYKRKKFQILSRDSKVSECLVDICLCVLINDNMVPGLRKMQIFFKFQKGGSYASMYAI